MAAHTAIGLDIGTSGVRAAQVTVAHGQLTLDRFGQVALPHGAVRDGEVADADAVAEAIKSLWASAKFSSKKVALGVANQRVVVRQVTLPWMEPKDLKESLKYQVADLVPMPVDDAVLDFVAIDEVDGDNGRQVRGLLVAAAQDMVLGSIRAAQKAGLTPTTVDLTPFAVLRSLGSAQTTSLGAPEALVDIGAKVTNIIVHEGGVPLFVRVLLMGGEDVTDTLVEKLGVSLAEAESLKRVAPFDPSPGAQAAQRVLLTAVANFVGEVRGSVDYYLATSGSRPLSRLVLSGGGARLAGLTERLAEATRTQVVHGSTFAQMEIGKTGLSPDQLRFVESMAAVPVGLAMGVAS